MRHGTGSMVQPVNLGKSICASKPDGFFCLMIIYIISKERKYLTKESYYGSLNTGAYIRKEMQYGQ